MNRSGFTLVELVIVMAVISLILSVVVPHFRGMQQEGELTRSEEELQTLKSAVLSYWRHHEAQYPTDIGNSLVSASPQIIAAELVDPFKTDGPSYGYATGTDATFGDYFYIWTKGPRGDTSPQFSGGQVVFSGGGRVVSNAPVVGQ